MARYFLHLHEPKIVLTDVEGCECASVEEAIQLATASARDVMIGEIREGRLCLACYISIADSAQAEVGRVRFRDAVTVSEG